MKRTPETCARTGKRCYPSHLAAVVGAARLLRPGYGMLRPYRCGYCGRYHLTHQTKRTEAM